jgi:glycosyltransferase involved in cell wall biosynthesis
VRTVLDVTPLLGPRTGVGRYVSSLARELGSAADRGGGDSLAGIGFTARGHRSLRRELPAGFRAVGPPAPARLLHKVWARHERPPVTLFTGRADVFHATNFVLPPTGRAAGVVTVHDLSFLSHPGTVTAASLAYRELVPLSIRRARVVLAPSAAVAGELGDAYGLSPDRVQVTHLGVDSDWYDAAPPDTETRRRLGLPPRYFVFVGNLEPRKNLPLLLDSYRALLADRPDAPALVLVGPPGWGPALDLRNIPSEKVVLTGYRADAELRCIVAGAVAMVYPTAYEGFGLPPLEAFACGTRVIASDLPVIREVVGEDPSTATLFPAGDGAALAGALARTTETEDPPEAADRRRSRARLFSWSATAAATRAAYLRALGR